MNFRSDHTAPVHPHILDAMMRANQGIEKSYGGDQYSEKLKHKLSDIFETPVTVYLTCTGTASNAIALSALNKPYEYIACHKEAHINTDECGAPGLFTGGSNLLEIDGQNGKIAPDDLRRKIVFSQSMCPHQQRIGCVSITQATECGTVYSLDHLQELREIKKEFNIKMHMDGARFANSLATLQCSPAQLTWKSGVDAMSLGATKNGCLNAEAVIFFNQEYAQDFAYIHKRAGQLMSKTRFAAVQFLASFDHDLWLNNAKHANDMALQLKSIFEKHHIHIVYPVESNELFVCLDKTCFDVLSQNACYAHSWGEPEKNMYRFVTSFFTQQSELDALDHLLSQCYQKI